MDEIRKKYDEDFKKSAVKLTYASPKTVKEIADDLYRAIPNALWRSVDRLHLTGQKN